MAHPGTAVSLVSPEATTAAKRRALKDVNVTGSPMAVPVAQPGFNAKSARWLHVVINMPDATTTMDWSLYLWDALSGKWCLDTRLGTDGVVSMTDADADNPQLNIVEISGVQKVYVRLFNGTGTFTDGADVWLGSVENTVLA